MVVCLVVTMALMKVYLMVLWMAGYLVVLNNEMKADQKGWKMSGYNLKELLMAEEKFNTSKLKQLVQ